MKLIPLSREGYYAAVDDEDFEALNQFKWNVKISGRTAYANRSAFKNGKHTTVTMHRELFPEYTGSRMDHRDGDGLK